MKSWLLACIFIILTISMFILIDISSTLHIMLKERTMRITEINNIDRTTWKVSSYGIVVLPDDDFNTKGYDEAVYPRGD